MREAIVAQLSGETAAGTRVYSTRLEPVPTAQLPAISVYLESESVTGGESAPRELTRTARMAIECWATATTDLDDALDALALEVETAMDADVNLDETATDSVLESTEVLVFREGARPMGVIRLVYVVPYKSDFRGEDPTDDFDTAAVEYNLEGAQDSDDSADDLVEDIHE